MSVEQRDLELVNDYCSGSLTDAEFLELEDRLRESSQLRQRLVEYRSIEAALPSALPSGTIQPVESDSPAKDSVIRHLRIEVLAMAAAIMLLVGGIAYLWPRNSTDVQSGDTPYPAVVTQAVGAYDNSGVAIRSGQQVMSGHLALQRGVIRLDFVRGATLAVEGPAEIEVIDEMRVVLLSGVVTAKIPDSAIGFVVDTDTAHVVDLGTAFGVSVGEDGTTDVCVFEGEVTVNRKRPTSSQSTLVREGQAVRASDQSPTIESTSYEVAAFENAWPVNSGVLQTTGSIRFVSPGPDFHPGNYEDNEHIVVFPERSGVILNETIRVNMVDPGQYEKSRNPEHLTIPAGRRVTSYLLQLDAFPSEQFPNRRRRVHGQITFANPIVGLITQTGLLKTSEAVFGNPDVDYPTPRAVEPRPAGDQRPGFDNVVLAADQRTMILDLEVSPQKLDQLRVLVEAD